jgi:dienelactone hydrolase
MAGMIHETPVVFHSQGVPLAGRLFRPTASLDQRQPIVIVVGSWLTVKEQMATTYARRLADAGYAAFVFDFAGFGASQGEPRQAELPARKILDLRAAAAFLRSLAFVDGDRIGVVAICASAQYTLAALAQGAPIRSWASVAGWFHDPASVAPFYGGEPGVARRLERARDALDRYLATRETAIVPAYEAGNDRAGMHFELDYYAQPSRGAIPAWPNAMAEMTWLYWLSFDGLAAAGAVATPSLFVHADGCVFPDHVRQVHAQVTGPKSLVWASGSQIDFYDQPPQVDAAMTAITGWFGQTL